MNPIVLNGLPKPECKASEDFVPFTVNLLDSSGVGKLIEKLLPLDLVNVIHISRSTPQCNKSFDTKSYRRSLSFFYDRI